MYKIVNRIASSNILMRLYKADEIKNQPFNLWN